MAGGIPKPVMLHAPSFDVCDAEAELRRAFSDKTKLCIFNTPHNPTGRVASEAELSLVAALCKEHDAVCLADEVYEACVFPGDRVHRRMSAIDGMWERTLTVGSASKLLSLTGWRVGWASGPADLLSAASLLHTYISYCAPTALMEGVATAIEEETSGGLEFDGRAALMHRNWERLGEALRRMGDGVEICEAHGGYFLVADVSATGKNDMEYCRWLAGEHKVAPIPLSVFYTDTDRKPTSLVRFAICKEPATIERAVQALSK